MKRPRVSIAGIMVLVAVVAVDWVAIEWGFAASERLRGQGGTLLYDAGLNGEERLVELFDINTIEYGVQFLVIGAPPMASLIALGCLGLLRDLARRGRTSPFLLGFVAGGVVALACFVACCLFAAGTINILATAAVLPAYWLAARVLPAPIAGLVGVLSEWSVLLVLMGLPQLLIALLAGWLNAKRLRVALVRQPHTSVGSEAELQAGGPALPTANPA